MADIPGAKVKLNDIEVAADAPVTEALMNKIGANINALIDDESDHETRITALETVTPNIVFGTGAGLSANPISVTITGVLSGSRVQLWIQDSAQNVADAQMINTGTSPLLRVDRNSSKIFEYTFRQDMSFSAVDNAPVVGSNTYDFVLTGSGGTQEFKEMRAVALEIK